MKTRILMPALAALALAGQAIAAHADTTEHLFSGYIDLGAGPGAGKWSGSYFPDDPWHETTFHGAAKAALTLTPGFSTQFDAWAVRLNGTNSDGPYDHQQLGVAGHLSWTPSGNTLIGAMGSLGQRGDPNSPMWSAGLNVVQWLGNFRFYGQAGYSQGFDNGDAAGVTVRYIETVWTYYHNPNLAFSAILGYDREQSSVDGYVTDEFDWGARAEWKKDTLPFSLYVSYQGMHVTGSYSPSATYAATGHRVLAGVRIPFGSGSLQDLDRTAGLGDLNPLYGDIPH